MDEHFSIDIAKYTKSTTILVGFNLETPLANGHALHKKVTGSVIGHAEPEIKNGQTYISSFDVVPDWNKDAYKRAKTEEEKRTYVSFIETENIINYELSTIKAVVPNWTKNPLVKMTR